MIAAFAIAVGSLAAALYYLNSGPQSGIGNCLFILYLTLIPLIVAAGLKSLVPILPRSVVTLVSLSIFLIVFDTDQFHALVRDLLLIKNPDLAVHLKFVGEIISSTAIVLAVIFMLVVSLQLGAQIIVPKADLNLVAVINSITPALLIFAVGISIQFIGSFMSGVYFIPGVK